MSIKLRANFDVYLENKDLHFDLYGKKLCIKTKCGKPLVVFNDLEFSKKEPTKDEIEFVKKILDKEIDELNYKLSKLFELENNKPYKPEYSEWKNRVSSNKYEKCYVYYDKNLNPIKYEITFEKYDDVKNIINNLNKELDYLKKYLAWEKEYNDLISELNQKCNI